MSTFLLACSKNDIFLSEIYIIPYKPIDLTYPGHGFPDSPKIILGIRVSDFNNFVDVFSGGNMLNLFFNWKKLHPFCWIRRDEFLINPIIESGPEIAEILISGIDRDFVPFKNMVPDHVLK